ncbi:MAG: hypothetical protein F4Y68_06820, partial [Boseongicola sp. SB0665_bin_10]|nr:hypothetical protein [Boseongicola sp. SB0665_bin_10]
MPGARFTTGFCIAWAIACCTSNAAARSWSGPEARLPELGARISVADAKTDGDGSRVLYGVKIEHGGRVIEVERMRWTGRQVVMDRVEARHAEGPDGQLLAATVVLRGVGSWHVFFEATGAGPSESLPMPSCAEMAGRTFSMDATNIVLVGDDDALPAILGAPERLTVAHLVALNEIAVSEDGCDWNRRVGLDDVSIVAVTGARLRAARLLFDGFARETLPSPRSAPPALAGSRLTG